MPHYAHACCCITTAALPMARCWLHVATGWRVPASVLFWRRHNHQGQTRAEPISCRIPRPTVMLPLLCRVPAANAVYACGEMSEWLKEHAWKVCIRLIPVSRVRIPLSPPVIEGATAWKLAQSWKWKESRKAETFSFRPKQRGERQSLIRRSSGLRCPPLWWPRRSPRDDSSQTPPGPEGSNGSG